MDNLAHSLVGLTVSKAGLERLSPGATTVCILAANAPDIDFLTVLSGDRWTLLHHHRGVSHSIIGTLVLGLIIPCCFWLFSYALSKAKHRVMRVRFAGLVIASCLAAATHPLLDWTNSYGVRPLLPWSDRWFYGDLVFVVDPIVWLIVGAGAFLLTSKTKHQILGWNFLGLVLTTLVFLAALRSRAVGQPVALLIIWIGTLIVLGLAYRRDVSSRFGSKLALTSLLGLVLYWSVLAGLHSWAMHIAGARMPQLATTPGEQVMRIAATPTSVDPGRWRCLAETDRAVYRFDVLLGRDSVNNLLRYEKAVASPAQIIAEAGRGWPAVAFLEFARFPVARVVGADCTTQTLVQFADLRYTEPGERRGTFALEVPIACPESSGPNKNGNH